MAVSKICLLDGTYCFGYVPGVDTMTIKTGTAEIWQIDDACQQYAAGFIVVHPGVGNAAGVSCNSAPSSNFQVVRGIVTRC